ncbi:MAG: deoxyribodipyrimidine photo-lyase [Alphaproteobacteria bacterium]|nr:deoxyribodipyrimidine photo-lyase [Alphaproteobacteria bacterium]
MTSNAPIIVWFRQDLRLTDNPALRAAAERPVIALYILDDGSAGAWAPGGASRWWLHNSLASLAADLAARGGRLVLRRGDSAAVLDAVIAESGATGVHWNRCYEPAAIARDKRIKAALEARGIVAKSFNAALLFEPWTITTQAGQPFKVYSPFARACRAAPEPPRPEPAPARVPGPARPVASDTLESWRLLPSRPDWAVGLRETWRPGERDARARLDRFLDGPVATYKDERNRPDIEATSRLSGHLHFGEISPRELWHATRARAGESTGGTHFISELLWREFSHHLLFHWPDLPERNWRRDFDDFPWAEDAAALAAWQRGRTGYPIVDAGMRELWRTGWMHNRVRMIVGSFLVKHLLLPWQAGEAWFWDTLVDADLANNAASWQWIAGCGADAAPYFRVFNPILQGEKFDPAGAYVRRWVPELARLPADLVHRPWEAAEPVLAAAGVALGRTYPRPIVDHGKARARALAAFAALRRAD